MPKICFKCGVEKPVAEFYRHKAMGDGRLGKCKDCTKAYSRDHYRKNRQRYATYERERNKEPARKAYVLGLQKSRRKKNPLRYKAYNAVSNAVRDGRLTPQKCEVCGSRSVQAHHDDYSKPLDVRWLCWPHHKAHHGQQAISTRFALAHKVTA